MTVRPPYTPVDVSETVQRHFVPVDVSTQPFRPDIRETILDLPVPPSVNRTRKVDWRGVAAHNAWKAEADAMVWQSGQFKAAQKDIPRFELTIILNERTCRLDQDNAIKAAIDYLRRLNIVTDDGPKQLRRTVIEWGDDETAPAGCRLVVNPCE